MSDKPKPGEVVDWQPLDIRSIQNYGTGRPAAASPAPGPGGFQVLYESEPEAAGDGFAPLVQPVPKGSDLAADAGGDAEPEPAEGAGPETATAPLSPDLAAIEKEAFDKGLAEGLAEGRQAGRREVDEALDRLYAMLQEIDSLWSRLVETHEEQILRLIARAAEKVVMGQTAVDREPVKQAILEAFAAIPEPVAVTVRIHPADYEYIESLRSEFFREISDLKEVSIIADPSLAQGGCKLETQSGEIDASIETRLDAIRQSLIEAYGQKPPAP